MTRCFFLLGVLFAGACAPSPRSRGASAFGPRARQAQAQAEEASLAAAIESIKVKQASYALSGADLLQITVYGEKDLDRLARVSQDGTITFPLVGGIKVGGLTVADAEETLAAKLRQYLRSPQVSIFIKEYGNKKVFVFGQVNKPGAIELPTEAKLTVLGAISQAGGFTPIAAPDSTRIIRLVNGKSESYTVAVSAITKRGQKDKDMALEPNDIIFIPESLF